MIPYDNEEETLITINGIPYVAVENVSYARHGVVSCSKCAFDSVPGSVSLENECIEMPCTPSCRKDNSDVIFREVTDVLL